MKHENINQSSFGMIGLGTMGSNLLQNIADHGYSCSGYDNDPKKVDTVNKLGNDNIHAFSDIKDFVQNLKSPKIVMMLVPAGKIVDSVIAELLQVMDKGDIIIDGGNSHFTDTEKRFEDLEKKGYHFVGMGVSGGEEGARKGPSMMPGGDKKAYETIKPILEKIAAHVNGAPTVAYMGERSAGHFVKMVHNGIEYALMQLISETYEFMKSGLQMDDKEIHDVFKKWNEGRLKSYLIEITRDIFAYKKKGEDHLFFNDIKDEAKAKGTGKWTSQAAMDLAVPVPMIDIAVSMRDLSKYKELRTEASKLYPDATKSDLKDKTESIEKLEQAFYFSMVSAYAQGMHLLDQANVEFKYNLNLDVIAKIWRGGCIIRSEFLEDIYAAYKNNPKLAHLFLDDSIHKSLVKSIPGIRNVVSEAVLSGIAVPTYSVALSYFDNVRSEEMPANLIQAQRDFFGSHTYELKGKEGVFHTDWEDPNH
ncbi:NADP-dependent phosphogluconate dehydrogenase [Kaistella flava (ex Peng et al. 2021)]|uniref:6-phosphogluconate dehydrogenase, decarboxylating n=1 Tax=Kaistella flava (ex Peng et al. 2021) TaxID=2038776 RepID=A0A7M2YCK9_9FLAO|nr:NADP-dependent phosphogluconate dehydrogenase [Kaistella flava (ex Peng et al. 2021)]QOW11836.1 NADP-dependent phosphogluconate dehydrogenase [Kaistella flava (ex Peng et al. 2021)]